ADDARVGDLVDPKATDASAATAAARHAATRYFLILPSSKVRFRWMRRVPRSFVCLVGARGGIAGRMEGRDDPHRGVSAVLERVDEERGQMDARAGTNRPILPTAVQDALALQHVDHLVVDVAVIGRAARCDDA